MSFTTRKRHKGRATTRDATPLALIAVIVLTVAPLQFGIPQPLREPKGTDVIGCYGTSIHLSHAQAELLRLHNQIRKEHGLSTFCVSQELTSAATAHSEDMLERTYYAHDTPEGVDPADRVEAAGYAYSAMAENIHMKPVLYFWGPSDADFEGVFEDWMESPGHRANILNPNLHEIGIGAAFGDYGMNPDPMGLYTADFGTPR